MGDVKVFRVPFESAESEFVEKRSRFITHLWPVETEEEAQAHIRGLNEKEKLPEGGITVIVASGEYDVKEGLSFTAADSGTEECPITWVSKEKHGAVLSGGLILSSDDFTALDVKKLQEQLIKDGVVLHESEIL